MLRQKSSSVIQNMLKQEIDLESHFEKKEWQFLIGFGLVHISTVFIDKNYRSRPMPARDVPGPLGRGDILPALLLLPGIRGKRLNNEISCRNCWDVHILCCNSPIVAYGPLAKKIAQNRKSLPKRIATSGTSKQKNVSTLVFLKFRTLIGNCFILPTCSNNFIVCVANEWYWLILMSEEY